MGIKDIYDLFDHHGVGKIIPEKDVRMHGPLAVDGSVVIHRAIRGFANVKSLTDSNGEVTSHIKNILDLVIKLYKNKCITFWVFDGKAPDIKKKELKKREEIREKAQEELDEINAMIDELSEFTDDKNIFNILEEKSAPLEKQAFAIDSSIIKPVKELLAYLGVPYIQAEEEADITLYDLCRLNVCKAVYSVDSDMIAYGCKKLIRPVTKKSAKTSKREWILYDIDDIYMKMGITREELIIIAIALGCDYVDKVKGVGIETIKKHIDNKTVQSLKSKFTSDQLTIFDRFMNPPTYDIKIEMQKINIDKVVEFLKAKQFSTAEAYRDKLTAIDFDYSRFIQMS
jgi:flap endonuclease-1